MKALILNTYDIKGGAALATYRLHQGLRNVGVDSSMLVQSKRVNDISVLGPRTKSQKVLARACPYLDALALKAYPNRERQIFSPAMAPESLASRVNELNPDIVHLFWVTAGFMRLESVRKFNRPIVWTLHDMWPFTGGCHYDGGCGKYRKSCGACPVLHSSNEHDLSRRTWERKKKGWANVDMTVVATSHWLAECAQSSSLFRGYRIEVIPNGLDENRYKPIDKNTARYAYNLPLNKKLILFSSFDAVSDKRKGFQYLLPALQKMAKGGWGEKAELVILGASKPDKPVNFGMKAHYISHLHDDISQVLLYSAADVVVLPSIQENLSNTVMESLFCGTPVVAFNIGGMPDLIRHEYTGYLVPQFGPDELADGISWILADEGRHRLLSQQARNDSTRRYGLRSVAERYRALYQEILR